MKRLIGGLLTVLLLALPATAQTWPTRAVRIIVPFGPGSTPDIVARLLADDLQNRLGQPFIVENKAGASGNTGTDAVAKAEPDGYTLGISIGGPLAINTLLYAKLPYDPERDLVAITQLVTLPSIVAVNRATGITSLGALLEALKKEPGKFNFASIGSGSVSHLAMEAILQHAGSSAMHVPYPGSPAAMTALIRNDVQIGALPAIAVASQADSQPITMLAVTTAERSELLPNLPTLRESGIDVEADAWQGLIAPAKTPDAVVVQIHSAFARAITTPAIRDKLATQLMQPVGSSPDAFRAKIHAEILRWRPVIEKAKIKVN